MQRDFFLSIYAECEQWRVELLSPSRSPGAFPVVLQGKAGLPNYPHLFLFQSLWKLVVGGWQLRSCHLEVIEHMQESVRSILRSYISFKLLPKAFLGKRKPTGVKRSLLMLLSIAGSASLLCRHVACKPGLVLFFSLNAENMGCLSFSETFIWHVLGTTHCFSFFFLFVFTRGSDLNSLLWL